MAQQVVEFGGGGEKGLDRQVVDVGQVILGIDGVVALQPAQRRAILGEILFAERLRRLQIEPQQVLNVLGDTRIHAFHESRRGWVEGVVKVEQDSGDCHGAYRIAERHIRSCSILYIVV